MAVRRAPSSLGAGRVLCCGPLGAAVRGRLIAPETVEEIVRLTLHEKPAGQTHWSLRTMAERTGVSKDTVRRVWVARGLKPHQVKTFKISNDKKFEQKLIDVVGLYLNPPDNAVVLCMDEKSSVQALDRTQPSLPMKKGRAGTRCRSAQRTGRRLPGSPPSSTPHR